MDVYEPKRLKLPIERNPVTRQVEICVSGWWKWAAGVAATLLTAAVIATVSMLLNITVQLPLITERQTMLADDIAEIKGDVEKLDERLHQEMRSDK